MTEVFGMELFSGALRYYLFFLEYGWLLKITSVNQMMAVFICVPISGVMK